MKDSLQIMPCVLQYSNNSARLATWQLFPTSTITIGMAVTRDVRKDKAATRGVGYTVEGGGRNVISFPDLAKLCRTTVPLPSRE